MAIRGVLALVISLAVASFAGEPAARSYRAHVVHIRDGDSLIVSDGSRQRDLRIAQIDTPERGQAWGRRAAQALARLIEGHELRVEFLETDRYGREVSELWAGDVCVGCALVRDGHAWAFRRYLRDPALLGLENEARAARRGLWSLAAHTWIAPWEWRGGVRAPSTEALAAFDRAGAAKPEQAPPACGAKRYCREMSSCNEAGFYLRECGVQRLDRDGDGIACDELCS
ncbi:MAG TPA: thermonuclease family protein [Myxococcota bacterium]|nr:thermonuclease family protein [Myxococcota bacterium]